MENYSHYIDNNNLIKVINLEFLYITYTIFPTSYLNKMICKKEKKYDWYGIKCLSPKSYVKLVRKYL